MATATSKNTNSSSKSDKGDTEPAWQTVGNTSGRTTKFIPILPDQIGLIIGTGGSTIRSLKEESGATIFVDKTTAASQIRIHGEDEQIKKAEDLIQNLLGGVINKVIQVDRSCIGSIIGKRGTRIKEIQEKSGARVKVLDLEDGVKGKTNPIQISGSKKQVKAAEFMIMKDVERMKDDETLEDQGVRFTQLSITDNKLKLMHIDPNVKQQDILDLYPDTHLSPTNIAIKVPKSGVGKFATVSFSTPAAAKIWMKQLKGQILLSRRIAL